MVILTTGTFLLFTCMHFWVWVILPRRTDHLLSGPRLPKVWATLVYAKSRNCLCPFRFSIRISYAALISRMRIYVYMPTIRSPLIKSCNTRWSKQITKFFILFWQNERTVVRSHYITFHFRKYWNDFPHNFYRGVVERICNPYLCNITPN
jgi:hypothetical protein